MGFFWGIVIVSVLLAGPAGEPLLRADDVRVSHEREEPVAVEPGGRFTVPLSVEASMAGPYRGTTDLPEGWRLLGDRRSFSLEADDSTVRLLSVVVPVQAKAGRYDLSYRVAHAEEDDVQDSATVTVQVAERRALRVQVQQRPSFAVGGDTLSARFTLENRGNVADPIRARVTSSIGTPLTDRSALELAPGERRTVDVDVVLPEDLQADERHVLRLEAQQGDATASAEAETPVYPSRDHGHPSYHRYPISVSGAAGAVQSPLTRTTDYRLEASGRAPLWEGGETTLAFDLRGPRGGASSTSLLRGRDHYRARLTHPNARLEVGDHGFSMSRLTRSGRGRFGVGAGAAAGPVEAYGYAARSRYGVTDARHAGGELDVTWGPQAQTGLNYVWKEGRFRGRVLSVEGEVGSTGSGQLSGEHSVAWTEGQRSHASQVDGQYQTGLVSVRGQYSRYGSAYPAFRQDSHRLSSTLRITPSSAFSVRTTYNLMRRGDTQRMRGRLGTSLGEPLRLYYEQRRRQVGPAERRTNDIRDDAVGVRLKSDGRTWRGQVRGEVGRVLDRPTGAERFEHRYRLSGSYRPGDVRLRGHAGYTERTSFFTGARRRNLQGGLRLSKRWGGATEATLDATAFRSAQLLDGLPGASSTEARLRGQIEHEFLGDQRLTVEGRYRNGTQRRGTVEAAVRLTIPIGVPVHRSRETGVVRGRLIDEAEAGLGHVPITVGGKSLVTGEGGEFVFPRLAPGTYPIQVDDRALKGERIPDPRSNRTVTVHGGATREVTVRAVQTGAVSGRVLVERRTGLDRDVQRSGAEGIVVVLTDSTAGAARQRRVTSADGQFAFENVPPGRYSVRLDSTSLPERHAPLSLQKTVELAPGATRETEFVVRSQERPLQPMRDEPLVVGGEDEGSEDEGVEDEEAAPTEEPYLRYTVRPFDSLTRLAQMFYTDLSRWRELFEANRPLIEVPDHITPDTEFVVPLDEDDTVTYTVRPFDTLSRLAHYFYADKSLWRKIYEANRDRIGDPDRLEPGTRLVIPPLTRPVEE